MVRHEIYLNAIVVIHILYYIFLWYVFKHAFNLFCHISSIHIILYNTLPISHNIQYNSYKHIPQQVNKKRIYCHDNNYIANNHNQHVHGNPHIYPPYGAFVIHSNPVDEWMNTFVIRITNITNDSRHTISVICNSWWDSCKDRYEYSTDTQSITANCFK